MFKVLSRLALAGSFILTPAIIGGFVPATAQSSEDVGYIGVVKGTDVYVRCGAAESYYPFAKVNAGDLVKVTGEKFDWARVVTLGPAFQYGFGYVKYSKGDAGRFRLAPDGRSGVTLGKTDIIAPNLESKDSKNNYKDSWKAIARLEANQTLRVLETIETDRDTIHKVALPEAASGWVSKAYLEQASESQIAQWNSSLTQKSADSKPAERAVANTPKIDQSTAIGSGVKPLPTQPQPATPTLETLAQEMASRSPDETMSESLSTSMTHSPEVMAPATTRPEEPKVPTLDDLENAYKLLQKEPIESAEVQPLRQLYMDLGARNPSDARIQRYSKGRAEQLQIWSDLQKKREELQAFRTKARMTASEADAIHKALESSAQYVAVGRVAASTIYDGERLPKLLRLQDAATGRTIAYLEPDEKYQMVNLIGNLVGIIGEKNYDEPLRLNIVNPRRVDILTPDEDQQTATAEPMASAAEQPDSQQNAAAKAE
jgi:hypothetical protein